MLLKYIGTDAIASLETGFGTVAVNEWDVVLVKDDSSLWKRYENLFQIVEFGSEVRQAKVTVPTASVLAMNTTPVTLVAAPGAGYAVSVLSVVASIDYVSAAYATNTTIEIRYTDGSGTKVTADIAGLLTTTADKFSRVMGIEAELALTANAPVVARVATGDPVTWDSDVVFNVLYTIVPLT